MAPNLVFTPTLIAVGAVERGAVADVAFTFTCHADAEVIPASLVGATAAREDHR